MSRCIRVFVSSPDPETQYLKHVFVMIIFYEFCRQPDLGFNFFLNFWLQSNLNPSAFIYRYDIYIDSM